MNLQKEKQRRLKRRHRRVRRKVVGTPERPRLAVHRTLKHIHCQIVDDYQGRTLLALSTTKSELRKELGNTRGVDAAKEVGKRLALMALDRGIKKVAFDRAGYRYHGRVKALAEGARESGLQF
ncbi:MAG: 50S ribosomal protein L18 [Planctomycetota bacterium]